jgi:HEAT repeat protein
MGFLGFAAAWVPALWLVGVVLAGLGFLLGACVLLWAMPRGAAATGFPAAGTVVSLQGVIVAIMLAWLSRSPIPATAGESSEKDDSRQAAASTAPSLAVISSLLAREELGKVLTGSEVRASRQAATALGDIAGALSDAVAELTEALNHAEPSVRRAAAEALGRLGPTARGAYSMLVYLSRQDPDDGVKQVASLACRRMGKPGTGDVALLCEGLKDSRGSYRAAVAQALADILPPPEQARDALREAMKKNDVRVSIFAAQTLWALKSPAGDVLPVLLAALEHADGGNRALAANALAQMTRSAAPALPALKKHLADKDPAVCFYTAYAIWVIQEQAAAVMPTLIKMLDERDVSLRAMTAEVLESIGPPAVSAVGPLVGMLQSKEPKLVHRAVRTLGAIGPEAEKAVRPMVALLGVTRDEELKQQIVLALGNIGPEARDAVPELCNLLVRAGPKLQAMVAHTLGAIGKPAGAAIGELTKLLESHEPSVQVFAAQALWKIANRVESALPVLLDILVRNREKDDYTFREAAAQSLGAIGPAALVAVPALEDCRRDDPHSRVQAAAAAALEAIGEPDKEEVDRLVKGLKSTHLRYRIECTRALAMVDEDRKDAISDLIEGLKDADDKVRVASALTLKAIVPGSPKDSTAKAAAAFVEALTGASESFRSAIVESLGALGPDAKVAVEPLRMLLKVRNVKVQLQVLDAMAAMFEEAKAAVPDLIALLNDKDEKDIRVAAAHTLGRIGPAANAAVDTLTARLKDTEGAVRFHAAHALNTIAADGVAKMRILKQTVPVLAKCLLDEEPAVRAGAAQALAEVGPDVLTIDRKVTEALLELRRSRDPGLRKAAETALQSIEPKRSRR